METSLPSPNLAGSMSIYRMVLVIIAVNYQFFLEWPLYTTRSLVGFNRQTPNVCIHI